jgi:flagellar basal body-associated protein FliL
MVTKAELELILDENNKKIQKERDKDSLVKVLIVFIVLFMLGFFVYMAMVGASLHH